MSEIIDSGDLASYRGGDVNYILELANEMVSDVVGQFDTIPARVKAITAEVASRALSNPDRVTSVTTSIDDWSKTKRWEAAEQAGVYLTDAERVELAGYKTGAQPRQRGSIQLRVPGYSQ